MKNGLTCQDWTKDTRDWVLKWVLARIATLCYASQYQIWIPEILKIQKNGLTVVGGF